MLFFVLLELEVGNAVAQQSANAVVLFVDGYSMSRAPELLRGGQPSRSAANDGHALVSP